MKPTVLLCLFFTFAPQPRAAENLRQLEAATLVATKIQEHRSYAVGPGVLEVRGVDTPECLAVKALELPLYSGCDAWKTGGVFYSLHAKLPGPMTRSELNAAVIVFLKASAKLQYHFKSVAIDAYVVTRGDMHGLKLESDADAMT